MNMSLVGGQWFVECGCGEVKSAGRHDASAHEPIDLPEITASSGGVTTATMRPRLVTRKRVNLLVVNWSSKLRHLALNSEAVMVASDIIGHTNTTGLYKMTIIGR